MNRAGVTSIGARNVSPTIGKDRLRASGKPINDRFARLCFSRLDVVRSSSSSRFPFVGPLDLVQNHVVFSPRLSVRRANLCVRMTFHRVLTLLRLLLRDKPLGTLATTRSIAMVDFVNRELNCYVYMWNSPDIRTVIGRRRKTGALQLSSSINTFALLLYGPAERASRQREDFYGAIECSPATAIKTMYERPPGEHRKYCSYRFNKPLRRAAHTVRRVKGGAGGGVKSEKRQYSGRISPSRFHFSASCSREMRRDGKQRRRPGSHHSSFHKPGRFLFLLIGQKSSNAHRT